MNITRRQAMQYRSAMMHGAGSLSDAEALTAPMMTEWWAADKEYAVDERLYYDGKLYRVLIAHTSQAQWTPDVSPSLFAEILNPDPSVIPEWVQPGSTNAYMIGDKVRHLNKVWISVIDYNVYEPSVYGWDEVIE